MKKLIEKITKQVLKIRHRFPSPLPVGMKELESYVQSITDLYDLPSGDTYMFAVSNMIQHLPPQTDSMPRAFFAKSIRKAMANQICFEKIQELKKQKTEATQKTDEKPQDAPQPQEA